MLYRWDHAGYKGQPPIAAVRQVVAKGPAHGPTDMLRLGLTQQPSNQKYRDLAHWVMCGMALVNCQEKYWIELLTTPYLFRIKSVFSSIHLDYPAQGYGGPGADPRQHRATGRGRAGWLPVHHRALHSLGGYWDAWCITLPGLGVCFLPPASKKKQNVCICARDWAAIPLAMWRA